MSLSRPSRRTAPGVKHDHFATPAAQVGRPRGTTERRIVKRHLLATHDVSRGRHRGGVDFHKCLLPLNVRAAHCAVVARAPELLGGEGGDVQTRDVVDVRPVEIDAVLPALPRLASDHGVALVGIPEAYVTCMIQLLRY
jgi:hypothetical protein